MGCWFKTCGLTNLPVYPGEEVYTVILEQSLDHNRCYATSFWKPVLLPFLAKYNDYGAGEECDQEMLGILLDKIKDGLVEIEQGENPYHDIPVSRDSFGEELFFEAVHEHRLQVKDVFKNKVDVDFVMLKKTAVDKLLDTWKIERYVGLDPDTKQGIYETFGFEDIVREIPEFINELVNDESLFVMDLLDKGNIGRIVRLEDYRYSSILRVLYLIKKEAKAGNTELAATLLKEHVRACMVDMFFERTRRLWQPGCYEGSQDNDFDPYKILLDVVQQEIAEKEKDIDE